MSPPCGNLSHPVLLSNQVCEAGAENCTLVTSSPGATVVSPVLLCLTGITGKVVEVEVVEEEVVECCC